MNDRDKNFSGSIDISEGNARLSYCSDNVKSHSCSIIQNSRKIYTTRASKTKAKDSGSTGKALERLRSIWTVTRYMLCAHVYEILSSLLIYVVYTSATCCGVNSTDGMAVSFLICIAVLLACG
jgi:hypothetical protein